VAWPSAGQDRFSVVGHDRGALVAFRAAMDHPDAVERLVVMDGLPVIEHLERLNEAFVRTWWHWWFLGQTDRPAEPFINTDPGRWYRAPSPAEMGELRSRGPAWSARGMSSSLLLRGTAGGGAPAVQTADGFDVANGGKCGRAHGGGSGRTAYWPGEPGTLTAAASRCLLCTSPTAPPNAAWRSLQLLPVPLATPSRVAGTRNS
jgi:pimeloyl-ACP methyl ester carboxylesterase